MPVFRRKWMSRDMTTTKFGRSNLRSFAALPQTPFDVGDNLGGTLTTAWSPTAVAATPWCS
jgi:hypothetical protein